MDFLSKSDVINLGEISPGATNKILDIISVFFLGLNWEYERFMMMMTLPYILIFSTLLNKNSTYFFLFISISSLLLLTIHNGMYDALK